MSWSPASSADSRALRARVYRAVREFFHQQGVLEVETPILSARANTDPQIDSLICPTTAGDRYLRTSPEFPMKRLLAAGSGPIYELGRVFRADEAGRYHNPEFTLLEWYRPGYSLDQLIDEVVKLVTRVSAIEDQDLRVKNYRYQERMITLLGIDPLTASDQSVLELVRDRGWYDGDLDRSACLDLMFSYGIVPSFPGQQLTVISDFPACQCALARLSDKQPGTALRFEVFIGNLELANGYDELFDAAELRMRFAAENQSRIERGKAPMPIDVRLLDALSTGVEAGCGVALGMDRWLMSLANSLSIDGVISFPEGIA